MSKMKHLLRKLHIGNDRLADHRPTPPPPPLNSSSSSSSSSSASTSSFSSSLSLSSASPSPASASSSVSSSASKGNMSNPGAGGSRCDPSAFEEEYQVQLALALSASDPNGVEDLDSVQIKAAKRMSLASTATADVGGSSGGSGGGAGESLMDLLSLRYWSYNVVNYEEKLRDGFYDVYGVISNSNSQGKMPSLVDLQAIPVSDNIDYEVVLVNRTVDRALQQLESRAMSIAMESKAAELGPIGSGLVQKIADLVVDSMGGPVSDAEDMSRRWTSKSFELRTSLNTIVLPLGLLEIGLSRHRALLFKVLADLVNLPCKLVKGSYYTGMDEGAVNLIKVDYDNEYIVDLMGAPGALIPAEVPSTHLQNPGLNLLTLDTIDQTVKDLCLALDNVNSQFEKKSQVSEGSSSCGSSFSGSVGLPSEQRSRPGPPAAVDSQSNFEKITEKSGHEFGVVFPPMGRSRVNTSGTAEVISPAQKMKVHDVSKYVVTAAKNPEFAQKLHAVLLESGASPPLDLFSDLNLSQNLVEQKELGNTEVQKDGQFPKHGELESVNCAADTRNQKFFAVDNSDRKGRNYDMFTSPTNVISPSPFGTSNEGPVAQNSRANDISFNNSLPKGTDLVIENAEGSFASCQKQFRLFSDICETDSSKQQFVNTAKELGSKGLKANVGKTISSGGTEGNGFHIEFQETAKDSSVQLLGKDESVHHDLRYLDNERIHSLLDGVAEWEIPWEDLQIGERIGLGSYGEVYHADWNGTEVAVKKFLEQGLSGDALEQFRCEVKIMLRLRHPNVVLFMGAVTRPPNLSILTEFLPRGSLYRLLHRPNVKLDEKRRLKMALDVAKGMNYLHTSHPTIVHRDLKSPNLLVDRNWVVKVADFGLSRLKHHTFLSSKSTAGTPEWMAPEVLRNEPSNEKCDIYSFGVILWELATMRMPWSGMNPMQVVGAVGFQNRRLDIPKEVDPMIAKIITECWDSEPNQRPSFAQIMFSLKQLQHLVVAPT